MRLLKNCIGVIGHIIRGGIILLPQSSHILITERDGRVQITGKMERDKMRKIMEAFAAIV